MLKAEKKRYHLFIIKEFILSLQLDMKSLSKRLRFFEKEKIN